jgi:hypothetical protein
MKKLTSLILTFVKLNFLFCFSFMGVCFGAAEAGTAAAPCHESVIQDAPGISFEDEIPPCPVCTISKTLWQRPFLLNSVQKFYSTAVVPVRSFPTIVVDLYSLSPPTSLFHPWDVGWHKNFLASLKTTVLII